jgi:peptide methionine sulfoxide reductase MsrA
MISYEEILDQYFEQLGDGIFSPSYSCQYRNAILVHSEEQKEIAKSYVLYKQTSNVGRKVFVDIEEAGDFYRAEEYHQKYLMKSQQSYF